MAQFEINVTVSVTDEEGNTESRERVVALDRSTPNAAFGTFTRALDKAIPQDNWRKVSA